MDRESIDADYHLWFAAKLALKEKALMAWTLTPEETKKYEQERTGQMRPEGIRRNPVGLRGRYFVKSSKNPNLTYDVDINTSPTQPAGSCTCPNFKWRKQTAGGRCKHIEACLRWFGEEDRVRERIGVTGLGNDLSDALGFAFGRSMFTSKPFGDGLFRHRIIIPEISKVQEDLVNQMRQSLQDKEDQAFLHGTNEPDVESRPVVLGTLTMPAPHERVVDFLELFDEDDYSDLKVQVTKATAVAPGGKERSGTVLVVTGRPR